MSTYTARKAATRGMARLHCCREERRITPALPRPPFGLLEERCRRPGIQLAAFVDRPSLVHVSVLTHFALQGFTLRRKVYATLRHKVKLRSATQHGCHEQVQQRRRHPI